MELLQSDDAHFYFCGLKRMYSSSLEVSGQGEVWTH